MTEEELQQILEDYGDISNYIKDQVFDYKKETTKFMDNVKYMFFAYLMVKAGKSIFNDKLEEEYKNFQTKINKQANKGYKNIVDLTNYINETKYTKIDKKTLTSELNAIIEQFKIDTKSTKTASDKYIRVIENYYNKFENTIEKDWVQIDSYLSSKVSKFDKIEKSVAYNNPNAKNGKAYYDIASYNSMVYNSNLTNTGVIETIKSCVELGEDIVYIPPHPFSCQLCSDYQGKFYSLTGRTTFYQGQMIRPYEYAIYWNGGGLNHPNCSHIPQPRNDFQEVSDAYSGEIWQERYDAKQKKQALELKKSRLLTDNKIYKELGDLEAVDKNNSKIKKLNTQIKEQKELMS